MTTPPGDDERPDDNPYRQPPGQPGVPYPPPPDGSPYGGGSYGGSPYGGGSYGGGPPAGPPPVAGQYGGQPPYGYPAPGVVPDHPKATTALVLGILGIVLCGIMAPFAWRIGKHTVDEIDASNGQVGGRGAAQAGYVLGLIGTVLLGLVLVVVVLGIVGVVIGVASHTTTSP